MQNSGYFFVRKVLVLQSARFDKEFPESELKSGEMMMMMMMMENERKRKT